MGKMGGYFPLFSLPLSFFSLSSFLEERSTLFPYKITSSGRRSPLSPPLLFFPSFSSAFPPLFLPTRARCGSVNRRVKSCPFSSYFFLELFFLNRLYESLFLFSFFPSPFLDSSSFSDAVLDITFLPFPFPLLSLLGRW